MKEALMAARGRKVFWAASWDAEGGRPNRWDLDEAKEFAKDAEAEAALVLVDDGGSKPGCFDLSGKRTPLPNPAREWAVCGGGCAGDHISKVGARLAEMAGKVGAGEAMAWFNGALGAADLSALSDPLERGAAVADAVLAEMRRSRQAYEESAEGQEAARKEALERAASLAKASELTDEVLAALAGGVRFSELAKALGDWASYDREGMRVSEVCDKLEEAGFTANEGVGDERVKNKTDLALFARYCVGQILDMGRRGGAIHPMIGEWLGEAARSAALLAKEEEEELLAGLPSGLSRKAPGL